MAVEFYEKHGFKKSDDILQYEKAGYNDCICLGKNFGIHWSNSSNYEIITPFDEEPKSEPFQFEPFNLQDLLAGRPVCYRNGENPVHGPFYLDKRSDDYKIISVNAKGDIITKDVQGFVYNTKNKSDYDLVHPVEYEEKTVYFNVYRRKSNGELWTGNFHNSIDETKEKSNNVSNDSDTIETITRTYKLPKPWKK